MQTVKQMVNIFRIEINGFNQTFETLAEVRSYVANMVAKGYVKSGDKAVVYAGTRIKRSTETTDMFKAGNSRIIAVS